MYTKHVYCMKQQFVQDLIINVIFVDSREFFTLIFSIKIYRRIAEFILFWVGKWLLYNEQYFSYIVARTSYNHDEDDVYFVQDQNAVGFFQLHNSPLFNNISVISWQSDLLVENTIVPLLRESRWWTLTDAI
jgi:hypothetical protein